MKKRVLSTLCSLIALCSMFLGMTVNVDAEETDDMGVAVDGSLLTHNESSKGTSLNSMLRGKHLMTGDSAISKAGIGRIYAYGQTTANHVVDYVAVLMDVERLVEIDGEDVWIQVKPYTVDARDIYYVNVDDTLKVDRGYYYRVRCEHFAGNDDEKPYDEGVSFTDGIWIP